MVVVGLKNKISPYQTNMKASNVARVQSFSVLNICFFIIIHHSNGTKGIKETVTCSDVQYNIAANANLR